VKLDTRWWTPPIDAGVLPGVMRAVLLEELNAAERTITQEELKSTEALILSNALRGAIKARLRR
jgi:para-aminobenzoate synthetase/4-amino-4-deoxychorismate lyase